MRMLTFARRNAREMLRDPLMIAFTLGFPLILMLLFTAIQANAPVEMFAIESIAPGLAVFGLSFLTLFSATLVAKDRGSALLQRLYTTPLTAADFIIGYMLPIIPIAVGQGAVCYLAAALLGLPVTLSIAQALLFLAPTSLLYIAIGLLCGTVMNEKQVGGICGGLLTNVSAWLSGIWFDVAMVGGAFEAAAEALPFLHAVELQRAVLGGDWTVVPAHLAWVLAYAAIIVGIAVALFLRQMNRQ